MQLLGQGQCKFANNLMVTTDLLGQIGGPSPLQSIIVGQNE